MSGDALGDNHSDNHSEPAARSGTHSALQPRYDEIHRREEASRLHETQNSSYARVASSRSDAPFYDPEQAFVAYTVSQQHLRPFCGDAYQPALVVHGTFATQESAVSFVREVQPQLPDMDIFVGVTHNWILAARDVRRATDDATRSMVLDQLRDQKRLRERLQSEEFQDNRERNKAGSVSVKRERKTKSCSTKDAIPAKTLVCATARHPTHRKAVVCFLVDYEQNEYPEFAFCVLRTVEDDAEAERYIKNVAHPQLPDMDLHVLQLSEWNYPQLLVTESPPEEHYPHSELDKLMEHQRTCTDVARAFAAEQETARGKESVASLTPERGLDMPE